MTLRMAAVIGAFSILLLLSGCSGKRQDAVVVNKVHLPAHVEGTELKERQLNHEQWLVDLTLANGRRATAPVEPAMWEALKVGDRVRVKYFEGNYTGTIWAAEIEPK